MMTSSIYTLLVISLITIRLFLLNEKDRTHPYGTNMQLNEKYSPGIVGEIYGKNVFKGISSEKDTISKALSKIRFLSYSYREDIIWRRCVVFSVIFSFVLLFINGIEECTPRSIVSTILCMFVCVYLLRHWENAHLNSIKETHVKNNIKVIKKRLLEVL